MLVTGPSLRPSFGMSVDISARSRFTTAARVCTIFLTLVLTQQAQAGFVPIPLTGASYNRDMIVERTAPAPVIAGAYTTASMDNGIANTANSWYEQGYNTASPTTGLPPAGSTFTHQSAANHS